MRLRNYTGFGLKIYLKETILTIDSEGEATCSSFVEHLSPVEGVPRIRVAYGRVEGLPATNGDFFIVPRRVFDALQGRRYDIGYVDIDIGMVFQEALMNEETNYISAKRLISA